MKVVVYSISTRMAPPDATAAVFPSRADEWDNMADIYADMDITLVIQPAGRYLADIIDGQIASKRPEKVNYIIMKPDDDVDDYVETISGINPDCAIGISMSTTPLDWNPIRDAMIANKLREKGIRTICNSDYIAVTAFDKWRTSILLRIHGLNVAEHVYIHYDTLHSGDNLADHVTNPYLEYVLYKVKHLKFPVIIKSTTGAGSWGIQTADDFESARDYILDDKVTGDIMVEEFMEGEQFGTEIHGCDGNYSVLPPFRISTNEGGFTDPLKSVKFGPVTDARYNIKELQDKLKQFAIDRKLAGITEVDLVFNDGKWSIIEINPRWSGMTTMLAGAEGRSPFAVFLDQVKGDTKDYSDPANLKYSCNFKLPKLTPQELEEVYALDNISFISQYEVYTKETGGRVSYSEVIASGFDSAKDLVEFFAAQHNLKPAIFSQELVDSISGIALLSLS